MSNTTYEGPQSNTFWTTPRGRSTSDYTQFSTWMREENPNWNPGQGGSGTGIGTGFNFNELFDKQFNNTRVLMGLTNEYRTKEGATQGQMDEQAFRRLSSQLETQKFMQVKGAELTEQQRQNDSKRAIRSFKGKF